MLHLWESLSNFHSMLSDLRRFLGTVDDINQNIFRDIACRVTWCVCRMLIRFLEIGLPLIRRWYPMKSISYSSNKSIMHASAWLNFSLIQIRRVSSSMGWPQRWLAGCEQSNPKTKENRGCLFQAVTSQIPRSSDARFLVNSLSWAIRRRITNELRSEPGYFLSRTLSQLA